MFLKWLNHIEYLPERRVIIMFFLKKICRIFLGRVLYEYIRALVAHGYIIDIQQPKTFSELLIHRKLYDDDPKFPVLADKLDVRQYVENLVGPYILNQIYFSGKNTEGLDYSLLPEKFVVKASHGSGNEFVLIVKDKSDITEIKLKTEINRMLSTPFGYNSNELWYQVNKPKIIIERFLEDDIYEIPLDYKFFVFNGTVQYIQVDTGRFNKHKRCFYNTAWDKQEFMLKYPMASDIEKPCLLDEMVCIAEKLGCDFTFVRIDLYCVNKKIIFGEITFAPEAGWGRLIPSSWDNELGRLWLNQ